MSENEKSRLNDEEILKKIDEFLSDNANGSSPLTDKFNELIKEVKAHTESSIKSQIRAADITFKYEELNHSSLVGLLLFNNDFTIQEANQTAVKLLKRNKKNLIGEYFGKFITRAYQKAFISYVEMINNTKQRYDRLFQLNNEGGEKVYFILESIPIINDKQEIIAIHAVIIDITNQKLSDIRKQSELIQSAVENMLDPFAILKAERDETDKIFDFTYLYVNVAATKANKLSRQEINGRKLLEISPSLKGSSIFDDFISVVETGKPLDMEDVYMEFESKDQTIKGIFHTLVTRLNDGFIITFRDITARKEAEKKLAATMKELERSNKELEQFAYIASHDLKEPLRTVTQFSKMLAERYKGKFDADADQYFEFISEGTTRMLSLLTDLLKYSRISAKGKPFQLTDFNVIAQEVLKDLKFLIEDHNVKVTIEPLPVIVSDPIQMRIVFQNLIENAVKFRSNKDTIINLSTYQNADEFVLSFKDNGIGIDPNDAERIFLIFQRLHSREEYPGTGMGLAICKKIIERHGGRIWVESEPGKGSTFYFTIPV